MLTSPQQTMNKTCLIGLSYFDKEHNLLKQSMLAGTVISVDKEMGITVELLEATDNNLSKATQTNAKKNGDKKSAQFMLPANLDCWFIAPKGDFHTSTEGVKITNPDYLVTWDILQTKSQENIADGEQQWWEWQPRTTAPQIG
ncbi:hypothetical protein AADZ86_07660 [Colwelliaceae bacterium BS250]